MRRPAVLLMVPALAALLAAPAAAARGKNRPRPLSQAPGWLQEAAARPAPEGRSDRAVLHDELQVEPLAAGGVRVVRRYAARARSPAGLESLGTASVAYRRGDDVLSLRAWAVSPDGTFREAAPGSAVDAPYVPEGSVFEDARARILEAPGMEVGDLFAYESITVEATDTGARHFTFGEADRPAALSRFSLRVPGGFRYEVHRTNLDEGFQEKADDDGITITARDLPSLQREELRPPAIFLLPRVWVRWWDGAGRGYADWDAVAAWYENLTRPVLRDRGEAAQIGARLRPRGPEELLTAIAEAYRFAAREVRYVSIQIGIGGYRPSTPAFVCSTRYGDCKDKTFLMRALLDGWEIDTYPALVRTRDLGPLQEAVPTPSQFNHCILAVRLPDGVGAGLWPAAEVEGAGRVLFLDPTVREGSPWTLPSADQGTVALLVRAGGGALVPLPVQPPDDASVWRRLRSRVDEQGRLVEGLLEEAWTGTRATGAREYFTGVDDDTRRREALADLQERFPGTSLEEHSVEGLGEPLAPVVRKARIAGGRLGVRVGDLLILEPGTKAYGVLGRRVLPAGDRRWPLHLGLPRQEVVEITIEVPDGWIPEEVPEGAHVESRHLVADTHWSVEDGELVYRRTVRLLSSQVPPEDYSAFREQVGRVETEDARAVVFVPGR